MNTTEIQKFIEEYPAREGGWANPTSTFLEEVEYGGADSPFGRVEYVTDQRNGGYYEFVFKIGDRYFMKTAPYHSEYGIDWNCSYDTDEVKPKEVFRTEWINV